MKLSNLKIAVALLVFMALYGSYNIPGVKAQKVIQVICTLLSIACMVLIIRNPAEQKKKWWNVSLAVLLLVTLVGFIIGK
ncbi:hypothetical protein [Leadbetterella sp. DM7]|uniref:hypothetical protein n=1 Tax=Leadbetterella sp. DM7 TaxID=3235085 RepID=UPI00349ED2B7